MLRTVSEIQTQVKEAYEDTLMSQIDSASRERKEEIEVSTSSVPDWLRTKLRTYGYKLQHIDVNKVVISWRSNA